MIGRNGTTDLPRVAVVLPVYRRPRLVRETLESILAQTHAPDRLIVVDDGSGDGTADAVEAWIAERRPPFPSRVLRLPANRGAAAARNAGAREAGECEVLAFPDSDDLWEPGFLRAATGALAQEPDAVAAATDKLTIDFRTGMQQVERKGHYASRTTEMLFKCGPSGTSNTVFRAGAFRAEGGYDEALMAGEDTDLMLRLSLRGAWVCVPEVLATYRYRAGDAAGEAGSLADSFADVRLQRALQLANFVHEKGGCDALPEGLWRRILSRKWYRAGRQLLKLGRTAEARDVFRRSFETWTWNWPARLNWLLVSMRLAIRPARRPPECGTVLE